MIKQVKNLPIYKGKLVFIDTDAIEELSKVVPEFKDKKEVFCHAAVGSYKGWLAYFIITNINHSEKITHGMITHEVVHVAHFILKDSGVFPDFDNDEPMTYLCEYIADEFYKFVNKHNMEIV
jgi:galactose-1-phosphate uridylyltransferase